MTAGDDGHDGHDYIHDDNHPFSSPEPALSRVALGTRMDDGTDGSISVNKGRFSISGSAVNGTRFVGSSHWKIPRKSGKSKKVVPFSRLEFPHGMSCSITFLVVCTSSRSTVGHRHVPGFTTKWNNFLPIGNSTFATTEISGFFFVNGKRPWFTNVLTV